MHRPSVLSKAKVGTKYVAKTEQLSDWRQLLRGVQVYHNNNNAKTSRAHLFVFIGLTVNITGPEGIGSQVDMKEASPGNSPDHDLNLH